MLFEIFIRVFVYLWLICLRVAEEGFQLFARRKLMVSESTDGEAEEMDKAPLVILT